MQAIITRYHGPTNSRGSRIVAHCQAGRVTHHWNYELNPQGNHRAAALELARRLGWDGIWVCGDTNNGTVWVNSTWVGQSDRETFNVGA